MPCSVGASDCWCSETCATQRWLKDWSLPGRCIYQELICRLT